MLIVFAAFYFVRSSQQQLQRFGCLVRWLKQNQMVWKATLSFRVKTPPHGIKNDTAELHFIIFVQYSLPGVVFYILHRLQSLGGQADRFVFALEKQVINKAKNIINHHDHVLFSEFRKLLPGLRYLVPQCRTNRYFNPLAITSLNADRGHLDELFYNSSFLDTWPWGATDKRHITVSGFIIWY